MSIRLIACYGLQEFTFAKFAMKILDENVIDLWWAARFVSASGGSLAHILQEYVSGKEAVEVVTDRHGKPRLSNPYGPGFSVSHSGALTLIAVAASRDLGVDCEEAHDFDDLFGVADLSFTTLELDWMGEGAVSSRLERFFILWTRKEAVVKAIGRGLQIALKSFDVLSPDLYEPVETIVPRHGTWWVRSIEAPPNFAAACASRKPFTTRDRRRWDATRS